MNNNLGVEISDKLSWQIKTLNCEWLIYEILIRQSICMNDKELRKSQVWELRKIPDKDNGVTILQETSGNEVIRKTLECRVRHRGVLNKVQGEKITIAVHNCKHFMLVDEVKHCKKWMTVEFYVTQWFRLNIEGTEQDSICKAIEKAVDSNCGLEEGDRDWDGENFKIVNWGWAE